MMAWVLVVLVSVSPVCPPLVPMSHTLLAGGMAAWTVRISALFSSWSSIVMMTRAKSRCYYTR